MTALPQDEEVDDDDPRRVEIREWLEQHPHPSGSDLAQAGLVGRTGQSRGVAGPTSRTNSSSTTN
jgi:hypothetical protein